MTTIHRALKLLRVYHNLKQKDLSARLGISSSHLSELENGTKGVSYEMLEKYSAALRIPVSSIALFAEAALSDKPTSVNSLSKKAIQLLEWLNSISEVSEDGEEKKSLA